MYRRNKYGNKRTVVDGVSFHSKKEADRYIELRMLERIGHIEKLELQPRFKLIVNEKLICTYIADFRYHVPGKKVSGTVIEDVKGHKNPEYKLKKKLFEALYSQEIVEI